jgi:dihydrodipicolinate reductase
LFTSLPRSGVAAHGQDGATGYSDAQKAVIAEAAKDVAIVLAPNMSAGQSVA